jgi:hypothetical protein
MKGLLRHLRMARCWWHRYWTRVWYTRIHPSPMQREFNRGDPDGIVRACAGEIIAEMKAEGTWDA